MSTFDGIVQEFPFITIDYFRKNPERPPPLACFLSHAHSDHLQGLESFRAPFIYCSAATRELLLQIEKYPHRMNFNNGILESRRLHYKHLSKLLRPIPLNTPTEIDLTPRLSIRVTLLNANHCIGAVMFLIEGDGKAILYTGDIRSEPWWVDSLTRHPVLIPYTLGNKRLDKIYLDTTFADRSHAFRTFPTKAEGLAELLRKLEAYPEDTIFYFRAWTFGYEEVWMALSAALNSKIHVDRYQIGLYRSVASSCTEGSGAIEAPSLCGFELGNRIVPGCLSEDMQSRIHSCEPGAHCTTVSSKPLVYITPIVNRTKSGTDILELGAGGGLGDLYQTHELELPDQTSLARLEQLCTERIHDPQALSRARGALSEAFKSRSKVFSLDGYGVKDAHEISLDELVDVLSCDPLSEESVIVGSAEFHDISGNPLPRTIRFPYARHSSYDELCELVAAFKPRDIYPCTVYSSEWDEELSMQSLFGHLCSHKLFVHDQYMRDITTAERGELPRKRARHDPEASNLSTQQSTIVIDEDTDSRTSQSLVPIAAQESQNKQFDFGSLPSSSWLSDEDRSQMDVTAAILPYLDETAVSYTSQKTATQEPDANDLQLPPTYGDGALTCTVAATNTTANLSSAISTVMEADAGSDPDSDSTAIYSGPQISPDPTSSSQQSHTLTLSTSAFTSQSQSYIPNQPEDQDWETVSEEGYISEHNHLPLGEAKEETGINDNPPPLHPVGKESLLRRRAAYLAAREDSYEAWASVSLVSAGNNHTDEEVEL
ncbi:beta-lactamase-like protein [Aspergillus granulosus]|uniref:Beta-lactamase-like protein n=1 Tax=Aspergillus granulosus TaxID=176169 RepID=A0ABR4GU93_9EURO